MTLKEKLMGRKVKWTHFDQLDKTIMESRAAYERARQINKLIRKGRRKYSNLEPMRADVLPLPYGMAKVVVWHGTFI